MVAFAPTDVRAEILGTNRHHGCSPSLVDEGADDKNDQPCGDEQQSLPHHPVIDRGGTGRTRAENGTVQSRSRTRHGGCGSDNGRGKRDRDDEREGGEPERGGGPESTSREESPPQQERTGPDCERDHEALRRREDLVTEDSGSAGIEVGSAGDRRALTNARQRQPRDREETHRHYRSRKYEKNSVARLHPSE